MPHVTFKAANGVELKLIYPAGYLPPYSVELTNSKSDPVEFINQEDED